MKSYLIGIDGGGTRSRILVQEEGSTSEPRREVSGPANINTSVEESWNSIINGIESILGSGYFSDAATDNQHTLVAGLAGTEIKQAARSFLDAEQAGFFDSIELLSDGHIACLGAHDGNDGIMVSVGTGTIGFKICDGHDPVRVSGWGFPHSDEGSGAWLGIEATRLLFKSLDKRVPGSPLLTYLFEQFDSDLDRLVTESNTREQGWFGQMGRHVIEFYEQHGSGDEHLANLIQLASNEIVQVIDTLDRSSSTPLPVCLSGGLSRVFTSFMPERISNRLVQSRRSPEQGALLLAARKRSVTV